MIPNEYANDFFKPRSGITKTVERDLRNVTSEISPVKSVSFACPKILFWTLLLNDGDAHRLFITISCNEATFLAFILGSPISKGLPLGE